MKRYREAIDHHFHLFNQALKKADLSAAENYLLVAQSKLKCLPSNDINWAKYYLNKSALLSNQAQFDDAIESCIKAQRFIPENKHFELKAKLESMLGSIYLNRGYFSESLLHIDKAIQLYRRANKTEETAEELLTKGRVLLRKGKWTDALEHISNVLAIAKNREYSKIEAKAYMELGFVFRGHRFLYLAIEHFRDAEQIYRQLGQTIAIWQAMYERANSWLSLMMPEETIKLINQMDLIVKEGNPLYHFTMRLWYAIYNQKKDYNKALDCSTELLQFFENVKDQLGVADSLEKIGSAYFNLRQMDKAIEYGEKALNLADMIGDKLIKDLSETLILDAKNSCA